MLIISAVFCLILLVFANLAVLGSKIYYLPLGLCALAFAFGPCLAETFFPPVVLQLLLLLVALGLNKSCWRGPWSFVLLSCTATLLAFGIAALPALWSTDEYARLRQKYPYESMEQRLPLELVTPSHELSEQAVQDLDDLERLVGQEQNDIRAGLLKRLHEDTVGWFVNSPGFGVARVLWPSETMLTFNLREESAIAQPGSHTPAQLSPGELEADSRLPIESDLSGLHLFNVFDFVNPRGFGYVKDRRHVAGFRSHHFHWSPRTPQAYKLNSLDLVSLVVHKDPVAYVSANLPRMDELRGAPTRPIDVIEEFGLTSLRRGEDIFVQETPNDLRALGAVRAAKQCIACHGCERGELLGAFSYVLVRK